MLCHSSFSSVGKTWRNCAMSWTVLCHSSFSSVGKTPRSVGSSLRKLCHSSFSSVGKDARRGGGAARHALPQFLFQCRQDGERRTERAGAKRQTFQATERSCGRQIKRRTGKAKLLNFQASTGDTGDSGDAGAPGKRATDKESRRLTRRETEGGGRGQRRSRRATDGARSGSRLPWRLCGLQCGLLQASKPPSVQASSR